MKKTHTVDFSGFGLSTASSSHHRAATGTTGNMPKLVKRKKSLPASDSSSNGDSGQQPFFSSSSKGRGNVMAFWASHCDEGPSSPSLDHPQINMPRDSGIEGCEEKADRQPQNKQERQKKRRSSVGNKENFLKTLASIGQAQKAAVQAKGLVPPACACRF